MFDNKLKKVFTIAKDIVAENTFSSQIEIISGNHAIIQGTNTILEYDKNLIRINLLNKEISFWGEDFCIDYLTFDTIEIKGNIIRIEFV